MDSRLGASIAIMVMALVSAAGRQSPDVSEKAVVAAAATYVASYQQLLTSILADETYVQKIIEQTPPDPDIPRSRRMTSEIFFMFAPVRHDWMTIRDVVTVDGRSVQDRRNVREALATLPAYEVAGALGGRSGTSTSRR